MPADPIHGSVATPRERRTRQILQNMALSVVSVLLALLIAEVVARIYIFGLEGLSYRRVESVHAMGISGLIQPASDLELVYELKPNLSDYFKLVPFRTNSIGLREDKEYAARSEPGVFRVAVVGDSYTMPAGVAIEDAYHKVIETKLNARGDGRTYEFMNFGVGGYTVRQYAAAIRHKVLALHPDLILIGWCAANDRYHEPDTLYRKPYHTLQRRSAFFRSFLVRLIKTAVRREQPAKPRPYAPAEVAYITKWLETIKQQVGGTPVVIAYLGFRERQGPALEKLATRSGFHFVDTVPAFTGRDYHEFIIYPLDAHPNADAHRVFADVIYDYLVGHALL
jgi:GDSL-like Lipase/Acylhydrolase family